MGCETAGVYCFFFFFYFYFSFFYFFFYFFFSFSFYFPLPLTVPVFSFGYLHKYGSAHQDEKKRAAVVGLAVALIRFLVFFFSFFSSAVPGVFPILGAGVVITATLHCTSLHFTSQSLSPCLPIHCLSSFTTLPPSSFRIPSSVCLSVCLATISFFYHRKLFPLAL